MTLDQAYPIPNIYNHRPSVPIIERVLTADEILLLCPGAYACTFQLPNGGCLIYLPRLNQQALRRHEWAHCNGWGFDHPKRASSG